MNVVHFESHKRLDCGAGIFNPSTLETGEWIFELEGTLVHPVSKVVVIASPNIAVVLTKKDWFVAFSVA